MNLYRLTLPDEPPELLKANYNVAPTTVMPIVRPAGNGRELVQVGPAVGNVRNNRPELLDRVGLL